MVINELSTSLPQPAYDAKQVSENEALVAASQGIAMFQLMEFAGSAVFEHIQKTHQKIKSLIVLCGKGNNGGDGYVIARLAHQAGINVQVFVTSEEAAIKGDALTALNLLKKRAVNVKFIELQALTVFIEKETSDSIIIDCLFGIGFSGILSAEYQQLFTVINNNVNSVISVDTPSGLCSSTGAISNTAIVADETISFIAFKKGLLTAQAANYVGKLYLADLSIGKAFIEQVKPTVFIQEKSNLPKYPKRLATNHKGNIGLVLAIGGNAGMPGAIRLSAEAALRSGAGLVAAYCHSSSQQLVFNGRPEIMLAVNDESNLSSTAAYLKAKVFIIGPGLGQDQWAQQLFELISKQDKPCVVDADALHLLSLSPCYRHNWVLTPHPKEAAVLLNCTVTEIENDRFAAAINIAKKYGGICLLKGAGTLISDGDTIWINTSGNAGMASGGMGDVLSGIIAALMLVMDNNFQAVRLAAYIHGQSADIIAKQNGQVGMLASDLFPVIQRLINEV